MAYAMIVSCNGGKLVYLDGPSRYDPKAEARGYRGRAMACHWSKADWSCLYKTRRDVWESSIVDIWASPPSAKQIKTAAAMAAKRARSE